MSIGARKALVALVGVAGLAAGVAQAGVQLRMASIIAAEGEELSPGVTITSVNNPFTDGNGVPGFLVVGSDAQRYMWHGTGPIFASGDALPTVLTGGEGTIGIGNGGEFIYSPSVDGEDGVWGQDGLIVRGSDPAPDFPGQFISFASRPSMLPDGTAFWMSGIATTPTGTTTNRVFYKRSPEGAISKVFAGGDVVSGFTLSTGASNFTYHVSDNGAHHAHVVDTDEATASDLFIYLDGAMVHREGSPTGQGDNWSTFDIVSVNNSGNYIFTGDTSGPTATDEFVAFNGNIVVREGDTLDGLTIASGASLRAASINNLDQVAHIWGWGTGASAVEALWVGNGSDLGASSMLLLRTGDTVDIDGNGSGDYVVTDMNASTVVGPGLDLAEDGFVYLAVGLTPVTGGDEFDAVIRVAIPTPGAAGLFGLACLGAMRRRR